MSMVSLLSKQVIFRHIRIEFLLRAHTACWFCIVLGIPGSLHEALINRPSGSQFRWCFVPLLFKKISLWAQLMYWANSRMGSEPSGNLWGSGLPGLWLALLVASLSLAAFSFVLPDVHTVQLASLSTICGSCHGLCCTTLHHRWDSFLDVCHCDGHWVLLMCCILPYAFPVLLPLYPWQCCCHNIPLQIFSTGKLGL